MLNTINSKDNPKIKYAQKLAKDGRMRSETGLFFATTPKVVMDILRAGFEAESLFFVQQEYEKFASELAEENVYIISDAVSEKLSEDKTSPGVYGVFKMKNPDTDRIFSCKKLIILEDIQDPGNIGAIMRTALAFGYEDIAVSAKCADIYSPKVLRSSMTASVKLNVCKINDIPQLVKDLSAKGFSTVATCLENSKELGSEKINLPVAVLIGNEGNGLSQQTIDASTHRVKIPMSQHIESLNAAVSAGVMMWELRGE
ncbi:MAG: RNA methyltransferase [Oscillospiraceae bacterium]|nr:RNA methyltransferase [Oscillospiraceae bacterium]